MATIQAKLRVRPLRLAFAVDPQDRQALRRIVRANSCLWGGRYNYIIPVFKRTPTRYREKYFSVPSAAKLINGLIEAFQPDFLVEAAPGIAENTGFDSNRIISLDHLVSRDELGRRRYGIDLRSVCAALYEEAFRFVQRNPPNVILQRAPSQRYELLFAATFGEVPESGEFSDCRSALVEALDAKEVSVTPEHFYQQFSRENLYPLRVGDYQLTTQPQGWTPDPTLFYMDERSNFDIIEYWNLRALGWPIRPLPVSLASELRGDCELFIEQVHRPYPPPSNAMHDAHFLCSRSCSFDEMSAYVSSLQRSAAALVTVDPRFPRLWEEWGRHADHAEPQTVVHKVQSEPSTLIGSAVSIDTAVPQFLEFSSYASAKAACANVVEALPGGADVIPWLSADAKSLTNSLGTKEGWTSREGVVVLAGEYRSSCLMRAPTAITVFRSWAEAQGFHLDLSSAGRNAEQMVNSLGDLFRLRLRPFGHEEILKLLDRLAHGDLELELPDEGTATTKKRRVRMAAAPENLVRETLMRASKGDALAAGNHLKALLDSRVLTLGLRLQCSECREHTWFSISELDLTLKCRRCLQMFSFPQAEPPKSAWAYRVTGPFAVENFGHGAYSVLMSVRFLAENIAEACTWIPSFVLKRGSAKNDEAEADFGMFLKPRWLSKLRDPIALFGECKTFGHFEARDCSRMRKIGQLFPGAVLCFCTLNKELSSSEKKRIARIARTGRRSLRPGQQRNPVLVLTSFELFGQFDIGSFEEAYPPNVAKRADRVFAVGEVQEICDFTQQVHLGIESYYDWRKERRRTRAPKPGRGESSPPAAV